MLYVECMSCNSLLTLGPTLASLLRTCVCPMCNSRLLTYADGALAIEAGWIVGSTRNVEDYD